MCIVCHTGKDVKRRKESFNLKSSPKFDEFRSNFLILTHHIDSRM